MGQTVFEKATEVTVTGRKTHLTGRTLSQNKLSLEVDTNLRECMNPEMTPHHPPPTLPASAGLFQRVCYNCTVESLSAHLCLQHQYLEIRRSFRRQESRKQGRRVKPMFLFHLFWYPAICHARSIFCNQMPINKYYSFT